MGETWPQKVIRLTARAERAERERDEARAQVERLRAEVARIEVEAAAISAHDRREVPAMRAQVGRLRAVGARVGALGEWARDHTAEPGSRTLPLALVVRLSDMFHALDALHPGDLPEGES